METKTIIWHFGANDAGEMLVFPILQGKLGAFYSAIEQSAGQGIPLSQIAGTTLARTYVNDCALSEAQPPIGPFGKLGVTRVTATPLPYNLVEAVYEFEDEETEKC